MPAKNKPKSYIPVDDDMKKLPGGREQIVQTANRYRVELPDLHEAKGEIRSKCYLLCGRTKETGDRVLAIQSDDPTMPWKCFEGGCGKSGNFVGLFSLMKPGENAGGKPRGERFKGIAADIAAMVNGTTREEEAPAIDRNVAGDNQPLAENRGNVPLAESENPRARELTNLDVRKFVVDAGQMSPEASRFVRMNPYLTPEYCLEQRMGFVPGNADGDTTGGTMQRLWVSAYNSEEGKLLTWFGRYVDHEERLKKWEASDKSKPEPGILKFTKGFQAGIEVYGQDRIALHQEEVQRNLEGLGLIVVSDPLHVHKVRSLGAEAVATCLDAITREQAVKVARLARMVAGGIATVLFDITEEGEQRMKQALGFLAQVTAVRVPLTSKTFGGKFRGRTVASLKKEWDTEIVPFLQTGEAEGWSFG